MNKNFALPKYWNSAYKDFRFSPMGKNYPICKMIYKHFSCMAGKSIFEIGCFPGRFLFHFGKLGFILHGIDQTLYLGKLKEWLQDCHFKIGDFIQDDILNCTLETKYDIVFSSGFIEHFENFQEVIKMHTRLVKDNGYIFITAPNFSGKIQKYLHSALDKTNLNRHNLNAMDVKKWEKIILEERGVLKRIIAGLLHIMPPLRFLPNTYLYSPEIILVAKKNIWEGTLTE